MKRWLFRILLCLVLGVVTTVGVAWACAAFENVEKHPTRYHGRSEETIPFYLFSLTEGIGTTYHSLTIWYKGPIQGPSWSSATRHRDDPSVVPHWGLLGQLPPESQGDPVPDFESTPKDQVLYCAVLFASGWPYRAVVSQQRLRLHESGQYFLADEKVLWGITIDDSKEGLKPDVSREGGTSAYRTLPLRPIFPGFIINTLFYATIWFVIVFGWRMHLRQIRKWQGYCPMCKYDLRGSRMPKTESQMPSATGCPECGCGRE